jgi:7-carboxy-7-deazaguanine synthase
MPIKINEIFYSIQGESLYSGMPCIFIRLTGCNLRCSYCDTTYAYNEGRDSTIQAIERDIKTYSCDLVLITGGEPLMQNETRDLIHRLLEQGYRVLLETNGSYSLEHISESCIKIVDIKCPSSNEEGSTKLTNIKRLGPMDQLKFVVGDSGDYEYAVKVIETYCRGIPGERIFFSPVSGRLDPAKLASWILRDSLKARVQLQLHKIIWPDELRGR